VTGRTLGVVTASYPRFAGDPAGNFVAAHVAALRALGHRVDVIAAGEAGAARGAPLDEPVQRIASSRLFYRGGAPDALERSPLGAGFAAAVFTARMTARVTARAGRWDTIIAHWLVPSALAALPAGRPLVAIAHGGDVFTLRRLHLLRPVLGALERRGAQLVFVSEALRTIARAAVPALARWIDAARVQPMGIDLARFARLPRAPSDPPTVLVVARLVPIKGVDVAIAAMRHIRRPARLVVAGDGPERARLGAAHHTFLGEVTTARRDELLRAASVVVVPSRRLPNGRVDGTPMIALEALAAGVPVIASAAGGLRELAAVRLVPPGDPYELAREIDRTLLDPPSPHELRRAVANLDWRDVAERLLRRK